MISRVYIVDTIRVMAMAGAVVVVAGIGLWIRQLSHTQAEAGMDKICIRLVDIPPAPFPSSEQEFVIAYTNSILEQIRSEIGCGR